LNRMMKEAGNNIQNETIIGKSVDGIIENEKVPAEKSDFSGAATADPVEELLKNFSL